MKTGFLLLAIVAVQWHAAQTFVFAQMPAAAHQQASFPCGVYAFIADSGARHNVLAKVSMRDTYSGDLVVGFPNPNEVREISSPLTVHGNVIVYNNGELRINNSELAVHGNIIVINNGKLVGAGGSLRFNSQYLYQRSVYLANKAGIYLNGTSVSLGGFNAGCGMTDTSVFHIENTGIDGGTLTTTLNKHASFEGANTQTIGEMLFFENSSGTFADCSGLLTWLVAPGGCDYNLQLPGNQIAGDYVFPDSAVRANGMNYRLRYERCYQLLWGLIHESGSSVEIHNSNLLAAGAMFDSPQPVQISNLVNGVQHSDFVFPAADRNVRFYDTRVGAWNLYPQNNAQVTVSNCIFGEVLTMGNAACQITNSVCDGTGGFVGSNDASTMVISQCQIVPDVIARNTSRIILMSSSLTQGDIVSADNAVIGVFNTSYSAYPKVASGSVVLIASIDEPSRGYTGETLPVYGTIALIRGKDVQVAMDPYWLDFGLAALPDDRRPLGSPGYADKYREILAQWDTKGLNAGKYNLYANIRLSSDDTISISREVRLIDPPVGIAPFDGGTPYSLGPLYPNPATAGTEVQAELILPQRPDPVSATVTDIAGRIVSRQPVHPQLPVTRISIQTNNLTPGLYKLVVYSEKQHIASRSFLITR